MCLRSLRWAESVMSQSVMSQGGLSKVVRCCGCRPRHSAGVSWCDASTSPVRMRDGSARAGGAGRRRGRWHGCVRQGHGWRARGRATGHDVRRDDGGVAGIAQAGIAQAGAAQAGAAQASVAQAGVAQAGVARGAVGPEARGVPGRVGSRGRFGLIDEESQSRGRINVVFYRYAQCKRRG